MDLKKLREPFFPDELEWKPQSVGENSGKLWVRALAYVTNRAIMDRLDEVVGPESWKNEFRDGPDGGVLCGLSIKIGTEWVTKWDGSENSNIEAVKGGLSGAMKRAGVQWGIGRYLYDLDENFGVVTEAGIYSAKTKEGKWFNWNPPALPAWALPGATQIKERSQVPAAEVPPGHTEIPPQPPVVKTKRTEFEGFMIENKALFTEAQLVTIRSEFAVAGTTPALLDALKSKADGFLAANDKATKEAFEAGGFEIEGEKK